MPDSRPIHELAPMTGRSAEQLAKRYGFKSLDEMTSSFSKNAKVIDFGAGGSDLGTKIAKRRPDISWINFDLNYDAQTLSELEPNSPPNLIYMKGDILKVKKVIKPRSIDYIFSYALLPHIEFTDPKEAKNVLKQMSQLLKNDGQMYLGRRFGRHLFGSSERRAGSVKITHDEIEHDPAVFDKNLALIRVRGLGGWENRMLNKYGTGFFGRNRWFIHPQRNTTKMQLWDRERQEFIPTASQRGLKIIGQFGSYTAKGLTRQALKKLSGG